MTIEYQCRGEHPGREEVSTFSEWRELLWRLGVGVDHDGPQELAYAAEAWREIWAGHVDEVGFGVARGAPGVLGRVELKVIKSPEPKPGASPS